MVLIDSSIWVSFFRNGSYTSLLAQLIDSREIRTNQIILTELLPILEVQNKRRAMDRLLAIPLLPINDDWDELRDLQVSCLRAGISGIGIPDLLIAQNALQNNCQILSDDAHFKKLAQICALELYPTLGA